MSRSSKPDVFTVDLSTSHQLHKNLHSFKQSASFTDFTISVQGDSIACHKVVLAAACPYFRSMLESGMKEAQENTAVLKDQDAEVVHAVVDYIYTGKIHVTWDMMKSAIKESDFLQLDELTKELTKLICENITSDCCISWLEIGQLYGMKDIAESAKTCMQMNLQSVSTSHEFKDIDAVDFKKYLQDAYAYEDQDIVLGCMIEWMEHKARSRKKYFSEMLSLIQVDKCTPSALNDAIRRLDACGVRAGKCLLAARQPEEEKAAKHKIVAISDTGSDCSSYYFTIPIDGLNTQWTSRKIIPPHISNLTGATICFIDGGFVVIGGFQRKTREQESGWSNYSLDSEDDYWYGTFLDTCHMYLTENKTWTTLQKLPYAAIHIVCVFANGSLYAIGGFDEMRSKFDFGDPRDDVHQFDHNTSKWQENPVLPLTHRDVIACAARKDIFVLFDHPYEDDTEACCDCREPDSRHTSQTGDIALRMYDTVRKTWSGYKSPLPDFFDNIPITSGPKALWDLSCAAHEDDVFVAGGGNAYICASYNIHTDEWTKLTRPCNKDGALLVYVSTVYYVSAKGNVERYDKDDDSWEVTQLEFPGGSSLEGPIHIKPYVTVSEDYL